MWNCHGVAWHGLGESPSAAQLDAMDLDRSNRPFEQGRKQLDAAHHAIACLAVGLATLVGLFVAQQWGTNPVALIYIPPVLAMAVVGGLGPSLLAAVLSALAYNFYFTAPIHSLRIASPADAVTVAVLFLAAVVTSRLASSQREQARLAAEHAARNATIAGFARKLLSCTDEQAIAVVTVRELGGLFECNALFVVDGGEPGLLASQPAGAVLSPSDLAVVAQVLASGHPAGRGVGSSGFVDWQFRPIASGQMVLAAIGLARDDGAQPVDPAALALLGNLLDQAALALERARLEREARAFAALRERDKLRSALLASIGEDVRPRLTALSNAVRALKRTGTADKTLVAEMAGEVASLDRYVDNLVELAPADEQEPIMVGDLAIDLHRRTVRRQGADVHLTPKEYGVLAELARHLGRVLSHEHLLRVVWGPAHAGQVDYLRVAIRALRQKLEDDPARPALIVNEPAVGYRLADHCRAASTLSR